MCDFSVYGTPSPEWIAGASNLPSFLPQVESIVEWRKIFNAQREATVAEEFKSVKTQVRIQDYSIPTRDGSSIGARCYWPINAEPGKSLPVYMHLLGGGFIFGSLATEDAICARIAINTQIIVLSIEARHTPEHSYPTAWNDTNDAFDWLHDHIEELGGNAHQVIIGGQSSGGQLAASLVLKRNLDSSSERPAIAGQLLMVPCLVSMSCYEPQLAKLKSKDISSYEQNRFAPLAPLTVCRFFEELLEIDDPQVDDIELNPGNATPDQVQGLPPTMFLITGWDPMRDEGLLYAKMLVEAGVPVDIHMFPGLPHNFRRVLNNVPESARWDRTIERGIQWLLSNPMATGMFEIKEK
ncbi:hypothetical protein PFICI_02352 [Pestalotiopsis fici W106-1]|uniref:Alpha/beta hydrolase fold-3 domain-containing protein n=1 Tax=Pestalotiopsis fici (strain W106-1 / CGMCC3.15140) TaxID=1229662 RepID=W3XFY8_PESFW|nr:uncharacterized protein PFICI_02352 [Pestalotiopsis fici W106-1]ETS84327.1 hypothetical protein PFICI_02352 [Pestalotiopsis fici W106-1]